MIWCLINKTEFCVLFVCLVHVFVLRVPAGSRHLGDDVRWCRVQWRHHLDPWWVCFPLSELNISLSDLRLVVSLCAADIIFFTTPLIYQKKKVKTHLVSLSSAQFAPCLAQSVSVFRLRSIVTLRLFGSNWRKLCRGEVTGNQVFIMFGLTEGQLWSKCLTEVRGENLTFISAAPLGFVMFVSGVHGPQVTAVCLTCAHADLRSKLSVCLNWTRWALFYLYEESDWTEHAQCVHTVCS